MMLQRGTRTVSPPCTSMSMCRSRQLCLYSEANNDTGPKRTIGDASLLAPIALPPQRPLLRLPRRPRRCGRRGACPQRTPPQLPPPHPWRHNRAEKEEGQRVSVLSLHLQLAHVHYGRVRRHRYLRLHLHSALLPADLCNTVERGQVREGHGSSATETGDRSRGGGGPDSGPAPEWLGGLLPKAIWLWNAPAA
ncbi:hypothetical protein B0H13DRAFT_2041693 [Mycena leptocephala]|nr:hypothetical protein B0H13DRAFT_2041693 [Mycena leptocephala]